MTQLLEIKIGDSGSEIFVNEKALLNSKLHRADVVAQLVDLVIDNFVLTDFDISIPKKLTFEQSLVLQSLNAARRIRESI